MEGQQYQLCAISRQLYHITATLFQAINYMQQDLVVAKKLGDTAGECRAHGNLVSCH